MSGHRKPTVVETPSLTANIRDLGSIGAPKIYVRCLPSCLNVSYPDDIVLTALNIDFDWIQVRQGEGKYKTVGFELTDYTGENLVEKHLSLIVENTGLPDEDVNKVLQRAMDYRYETVPLSAEFEQFIDALPKAWDGYVNGYEAEIPDGSGWILTITKIRSQQEFGTVRITDPAGGSSWSARSISYDLLQCAPNQDKEMFRKVGLKVPAHHISKKRFTFSLGILDEIGGMKFLYADDWNEALPLIVRNRLENIEFLRSRYARSV